MTAYDLLFRHGFSRVDPEAAHHLGARAIRAIGAARPVSRTPHASVSTRVASARTRDTSRSASSKVMLPASTRSRSPQRNRRHTSKRSS